MLSGDFNDNDWKKNFNMSRELFHKLHHLIPYISPNILSPNWRMIPGDKKWAITLYFLKDTGSLLMTANIFGIALSNASKIIHEVCKAITTSWFEVHAFTQNGGRNDLKSLIISKVIWDDAGVWLNWWYPCSNYTTYWEFPRPLLLQDKLFFNWSSSLWLQGCFNGCGLQMAWLCPRRQSVLQFKNKLELTQRKATNNTSTNASRSSKSWKLSYRWSCILPVTLLFERIQYFFKCWSNFNNMLRSSRNPIECTIGRLKALWGFLTRTIDLN